MDEGKSNLVVITGGAGSLGKTLAEFFSKKGCTILLVDSNKEKLKVVSKELIQKGCKLRYYPIDVTKANFVEHLANDIAKGGKQPDLIINTISTGIMYKINGLEEKASKKLVEAVLKGTRNCIKYFTTNMVKGSIVTVLPFPEPVTNSSATLYSSLRVGLSTLTSMWARELAEEGNRVNGILPGFFQETEGKIDKQAFKNLNERIPVGKPGTFLDIAETIFFLSSSHALYINGAIIPVDGGYFC